MEKISHFYRRSLSTFMMKCAILGLNPIRPRGGGPFCHTLQLIDRQSFMDGYFNFNTRWFFKLKVYALPIEAKKNFFHESFSEILIFIKNFVRKIDL